MGECKYAIKRIEHPTSATCRIMYHCRKYHQYCVNQCASKIKDKKKAESK